MQAGAELDAALIDACRGGDRSAFAQIIERHHRAVYAVAFSTVRDRAIADDVTQDAFVAGWRRLDELRDQRRLPAWLCGIARNLARDACKRRRRERGDHGVGEPIDVATPYAALSEAETERLLETALGQVPDVYREPLVLYYYEDRSVEDVARALGLSPATTNKRLSRGRKYLAERVALVERGLARRGPPATLVASVLALVGVAVPASHVEASTLKGSTMHKLLVAAIATAGLGGGALVVAAAATRGGDAHAGTTAPPNAAAVTPSTTAIAPHASGHGCDLVAELAARVQRRAAVDRASPVPSPLAPNVAALAAATDCEAVGRHLADLEADVTHGPDDRPDDATGDQCAGFYAAQCASEDWSAEHRACALAAADLVNAHLCAGAPAPGDGPPTIPPALACTELGAHLATITRRAGLYAEVPDLDQQVAAACEVGGWSIELRRCFAATSTIDAVTACMAPLVQ